MPVSACLGGVGRVQNGAVAWPMGVLGGRAGLVERGGGEWSLVARCRPLASLRSLHPMVVPSGHVGEREGVQGEVRAWSLCRLGSR
jgi:hypothetical protein